MFVVELFIPLEKADGTPTPAETLERIKSELVERFGGVTAFLQSPAEGAWRRPSGTRSHDEIVIFEVMTPRLDRAWWRRTRVDLARLFRQEQLVVRAHPIEIL